MTERNPESLRAFQLWFVSPSGPGYTHIPLCAPTHHKDGITTLTLYRRNGYQAELALIPPGQDYRIDGQDFPLMSFVFLGGSCNYREGSPPGMNGPMEHKTAAPDDCQEEISTAMQQPDYLECPHPVISQGQCTPFYPLSAGDYMVFYAREQTSIMLLCGIYETDRAYTCLDYVKAVPTTSPQPEDRQKNRQKDQQKSREEEP